MSSILEQEQLNRLLQYGLILHENRSDAYDLLQGALEKYLIEIKKNKQSIRKPEAFIRQVMRNRFIDKYRHQKQFEHKHYKENDVYDITPNSLENIMITHSTLEKIWSELEPLDREILYYWAALGHSTDETSAILDIARGTLLSRIHRLRKKLSLQNKESNERKGEM